MNLSYKEGMIFKSLIFALFFFTLCFNALAKIEMRSPSVASVLINDGESRILINPAFTRPNWRPWFNLEKFRSDELLVRSVLKDFDLLGISALFTSHSHFDHAVDVPIVARESGTVIQGVANRRGDEIILDGYLKKFPHTLAMRPEYGKKWSC